MVIGGAGIRTVGMVRISSNHCLNKMARGHFGTVASPTDENILTITRLSEDLQSV